MSSAAALLPEDTLDHPLAFVTQAVCNLIKNSLQQEQRHLSALAPTLENAFDQNLFKQALQILQLNTPEIGRLFERNLQHACRGEVTVKSVTAENAVNFHSDELTLTSDSELQHQLILERAFNNANDSYESMRVSSGWRYLPENVALPGSPIVTNASPGVTAWLLQSTLETVISNRNVVRLLYRFIGARFFAALGNIYTQTTAPLTALVALHKPATPLPGMFNPAQANAATLAAQEDTPRENQFINRQALGIEVADIGVASELTEAIKAFASRPDIVEMLKKRDVPAALHPEDKIVTLTDIAFEDLRPDTVIKTASVDDVLEILRGYSAIETGEDMRDALRSALTELSTDNMVTIIDRMSENVLNLVMHLFKQMCCNDDFIPAVQKQLSRLQSPVTQAALVDSDLFQNQEHPIRNYLNTVGRLAAQITSEEEEGYRRLRNNVTHLIKGFDGNTDLFQSAANTLTEFVENTEYAVKWQNDELAPSDYQSNLRFIPVRDYLNSMSAMLSRELSFHKMMKFVWSSVLTRALHRDGEDSEQWKKLTQVYSDALWSTQASANDDGKRLVLRSLPKIVNGVREACEAYNVRPQIRELLLDHMFDIHMQIIRGTDGVTITESQERVRALFDSLKGNVIEDTECDFFREQDALMPGMDTVPQNPLQNVYERFDAISDFGTPCPTTSESDTEDPDMQQHFRRLEQLPLASVFEFTDAGESHRYVLREKSLPLGRFSFVGCDGKTTRVFSKAELVLAMMRGEARRVDDEVLFERSLTNVLKSLNLGL